MTVTAISTIADALKRQYHGVFVDQFNLKADPFLAQLEHNTEMVANDQIYMALRYGDVGGIAALATDISTLPTPNGRKTKQITFGMKNLFATIQISDKVIQVSKKSAGAFANMLRQELEDAQNAAKNDLSRQVYGDGTGALGTTSAHSSVNTITLSDVRYVAEGMLVDILASDGSAKSPAITGREITAVDRTNSTITIGGAAVTTLATDIVTRAGGYGNEVTGLATVFTDDNTLYGVDRSANKWMNTQHVAVDGEIDEVKIQEGIDTINDRTGNTVNYISTSKSTARAWQKYQLSFKQNVNFMELKGGWKAMAYVSPDGEIPIVGTKFAPLGKVRLLNTEDWKMAELTDWSWMDDDGSVLRQTTSNIPAWQAVLRKYGDMVCVKPAGQGELTGLVDH